MAPVFTPSNGGGCCGGTGTPVGQTAGPVNNKCSAAPNDFDTPEWRALEFSVNEPSQYRYSYDPGATTIGSAAIATAYAVGDLDCNTTESTWTLLATAISAGGTVTGAATSLVPPPKGTY